MKKKSARKTANEYKKRLDRLETFVAEVVAAAPSDQAVTWAHELALVKAAVAFEKLMLGSLVAALNSDTSTLTSKSGVRFPKHLTDEVCEYLVTGGGYFDFKGRDGLIKLIKDFVHDGHWLHAVVKDPRHKLTIERLLALRNFAAHESSTSRSHALRATGRSNMSSAGAYLKVQGRLGTLFNQLRVIGDEIAAAAPY